MIKNTIVLGLAAPNAEADEVRGPRELHHGENLRGPLHYRADAERDGDDLHVQADLVANHGEQRRSPPDGQGAADGEQHARAGNGDQDGHHGGERQYVTYRHHSLKLG
jgi:hypothetical protein